MHFKLPYALWIPFNLNYFRLCLSFILNYLWMTRNKSGLLAKCMSPESPRRRTWKWNMSLTAKSGRFVVLCYTQFSHWHLKRPCCAVDSRERRFPPTSPTKQNFVSKLSLLFEDLSTYQNPCFAQLFWWLYGVLERRHFMRSQDGKNGVLTAGFQYFQVGFSVSFRSL